MWHRIIAVSRARLREFYRDKASLMWNLAMPLLIIVGFAFIFTGEPEDLLKIGVLGAGESPLLDARHVTFVPVVDPAAGILKVQRHQLDLLLQTGPGPRYWINTVCPFPK